MIQAVSALTSKSFLLDFKTPLPARRTSGIITAFPDLPQKSTLDAHKRHSNSKYVKVLKGKQLRL